MENNASKSDNLGIKALKVYKKYFKRFGYYLELPEIRLSGKWMQDLNFKCGETVKIYSENDRLLIVKSENRKIIL